MNKYKGLRVIEHNDKKGNTTVEVFFDHSAVIHFINIYSEFVDEMVSVDLERFEKEHTSRYNFLQELVNDDLGANFMEHK